MTFTHIKLKTVHMCVNFSLGGRTVGSISLYVILIVSLFSPDFNFVKFFTVKLLLSHFYDSETTFCRQEVLRTDYIPTLREFLTQRSDTNIVVVQSVPDREIIVSILTGLYMVRLTMGRKV